MFAKLHFMLVPAIFFAAVGAVQAVDPCDNDACCVNPATCVVTDKQTLAGLTVDSVVPCAFTLGTYCTGGNGTTGLAPENYPDILCGLSFSINPFTPADALNSVDHKWLQSTTTPKVVDFGSPVNTAIVFVAVDHGPFPEEGIESTVWGSDSCDISSFPSGWTLATLTTIWKRGWEDPLDCQGQDNADDFTGQYSFPGAGFRYVAVHADFSISIFDDPSHTSWEGFADNSAVDGWQSFDDEIDAVGTPECDPGQVTADAGPDQSGFVGQQICFDGSGSSASNGIANLGWDLDGDGEIDVNGAQACIICEAESSGTVTLFVTDNCGCVDSDTAQFTCSDPVLLDIKPGSCPNSFNRNSHGVLPVSLLGTDSFDVTQVDLASIQLCRADGGGGCVAPHEGPPGPHSEFDDTGTPFDGDLCDCHELTGDGITDLSMKFKTDDLVPALELDGELPGALVELVVSGLLNDGQPFEASDCVRLVPPGTPPGLVRVVSGAANRWLDVQPLDLVLDGGGFGTFERVYPVGSVIVLEAPAFAVSGMVFDAWVVDGRKRTVGMRTLQMTVVKEIHDVRSIYKRAGTPPPRQQAMDAEIGS